MNPLFEAKKRSTSVLYKNYVENAGTNFTCLLLTGFHLETGLPVT